MKRGFWPLFFAPDREVSCHCFYAAFRLDDLVEGSIRSFSNFRIRQQSE